MIDKIVVCDADPLIALAKINQLDLLYFIFKDVFISDTVRDECLYNEEFPGAKTIKTAIENNFIHIKTPKPNICIEKKIEVLDFGEKTSILLAAEYNAVLLIDEKRGRSIAQNLFLPVIGTAGLLLKGFYLGYLFNLEECLSNLKKNGYRLSDHLINDILERASKNKSPLQH